MMGIGPEGDMAARSRCGPRLLAIRNPAPCNLQTKPGYPSAAYSCEEIRKKCRQTQATPL